MTAEDPEIEQEQAESAAQEDSLFQAPPLAEQERMVEAMLFASADPLTTRALQDRMPHGCDAAEALVLLRRRYQGRGSPWPASAMPGPFAPRPIWPF